MANRLTQTGVLVLQTILCWVARWALHRRYTVQVVGLEKLQGLRGPTLVLPNHPGYIDPPLVWSHVRLTQAVRPVATTSMYRKPLLRPLMRLLQALEVPDLSEHSLSARDRTLAMIDAVVAGLERGECFLIYPSGHVVHNGREEVGAARTAAEVLARCPQANVVLVRTRGLWGSMFTYARTGQAPSLPQCALRGLAWMAANLVVFAPRRRVVITVEQVERDRLPAAKRETLNPFLEAWYNQEGPETPVFVPYHAWFGPRQYTFPAAGESAAADQGQVRRATIEAVAELLEERLGARWRRTKKPPARRWTNSAWTAWTAWIWRCRSKTALGSARRRWPHRSGNCGPSPRASSPRRTKPGLPCPRSGDGRHGPGSPLPSWRTRSPRRSCGGLWKIRRSPAWPTAFPARSTTAACSWARNCWPPTSARFPAMPSACCCRPRWARIWPSSGCIWRANCRSC